MRRMILPERVLGRPGANWILSGTAIAPISLRTCSGQFLFQFFAFGNSVLQRHEGVERLAFDVVRHGRDGGFGDFRMAHERALDFRRADAMAGDVHDVVHAAEQPVIAVGIHAAAVAGEIHVLERGRNRC